MKYMSYKDRLMQKVSVGTRENDCWDWLACTNTLGYGLMRFHGRQIGAARISYELFKTPIPKGLFVCHSCDNPSCVNPKHLWLGTQKDNIRDMHRKGRDYNGHDKITHCPSGHEYTSENTRLYFNHRICKQCDRDRNKDNPQRLEQSRLRARRRRALQANRRVGNIT